MRERIRTTFFEYGWLLPLLAPAAQVGGRALINILLLVYLLWALAAVPGSRVRIERPALGLYLALLAAYLISIPGALDMQASLHGWVKFTLHSLAFYFTLVVLLSRPLALQQLLAYLGYAGLLLLTALMVMLLWDMTQPDFLPVDALVEDNLPFLTPFMLVLLWRSINPRYRVAFMVVVALTIFGYVLYSEGRAALLGLIAALFLSMLLVLRTGKIRALVISIIVLGSAVAISSATFFREHRDIPVVVQQQGQSGDSQWMAKMDRFTSYRTVLWRQAMQNPPQNLLTGVGMANVALSGKVTTLDLPDETAVHLGHLHNFVFDAWYETGFLGLAALLAFVAYPFRRGWRVARAGGESSVPAGLLLASVAALLMGGLLSFSYASNQFALYLPMLLAALWYLSGPRQTGQHQA
jgi:O-antigen ligase